MLLDRRSFLDNSQTLTVRWVLDELDGTMRHSKLFLIVVFFVLVHELVVLLHDCLVLERVGNFTTAVSFVAYAAPD